MKSNLDYTIIAPSVLTEEPATGKVTLSPDHAGTHPIEDVAEVLTSVLERPNTYRKLIEMRSGTVDINEALTQL